MDDENAPLLLPQNFLALFAAPWHFWASAFETSSDNLPLALFHSKKYFSDDPFNQNVFEPPLLASIRGYEHVIVKYHPDQTRTLL